VLAVRRVALSDRLLQSAGRLSRAKMRFWPDANRIEAALPYIGKRRAQPTMRIFIAEDSALIAERLADLLSNIRGLELVGQATNVRAAALSIQQLDPDVVILDLKMPDGISLDLLEALKKHKPATVVIVFTALASPQIRRRCTESGADFFLDKSTDFETLPSILEALVENS